MTGEEIDKFYDNNIVDRNKDENGIKYSKEFDFNDILKDKTVQFEINSFIRNIDKYSLGNEIQVK